AFEGVEERVAGVVVAEPVHVAPRGVVVPLVDVLEEGELVGGLGLEVGAALERELEEVPAPVPVAAGEEGQERAEAGVLLAEGGGVVVVDPPAELEVGVGGVAAGDVEDVVEGALGVEGGADVVAAVGAEAGAEGEGGALEEAGVEVVLVAAEAAVGEADDLVHRVVERLVAGGVGEVEEDLPPGDEGAEEGGGGVVRVARREGVEGGAGLGELRVVEEAEPPARRHLESAVVEDGRGVVGRLRAHRRREGAGGEEPGQHGGREEAGGHQVAGTHGARGTAGAGAAGGTNERALPFLAPPSGAGPRRRKSIDHLRSYGIVSILRTPIAHGASTRVFQPTGLLPPAAP